MNHLVINGDFKKEFARFISSITHAPILSIPAFVFINYFFLNFYDFMIITSISIFFSALLPISVVLLWSKKKKNIAADLPKKKDRNIPLILVIISYLIGTFVLCMFNAPPISTILMFCYFSNTLIVFFINLFWKISIHSMGVAGPTTALIYAFGYIGSVLGLILPIVMWSRVYLKKHSMSQVIMGALLGFVLTAIQMYVILTYSYNLKVNAYPFLWLIYAFVAPSIVLGTAGYLNKKGMQDGYTRKIFHFVGFISIVAFLKYAPFPIAIIFIVIGTIYVGIACFSGKKFLWYEGIKRKSDSPNELLYVVLPMFSVIFGLGFGLILFERSLVQMGMLCVAIGDAIAEPLGVRFGKHKYKVYSLTGRPSERSLEGSLAVLFSCAAIIFITTNNPILSLITGLILAFIEAISPRGTDNFTVLFVAAMALTVGLQFI